MRSLITLTAVAIAAATLMAAQAGATSGRSTSSVQAQVTSLRHGIQWHRAMTQHYRYEAGLRPFPTAHAERKTWSVPFLRWIMQRWSSRRIAARARLQRMQAAGLPLTSDWQTAVRIVQRTWPGTASWLLSTSSGEGGWGGCVWNGGAPCSSANRGSGAAGWLQYMSGTFSSHLSSALAEARAEHRPTIPASARTWFSPLGQAFAGGWGCHHNASAWSRPSC